MNIKKTIFLRGFSGFPLGIAISHIISLVISLFIGKGEYVPCTPLLVQQMGSEMNAVLLQTFFSGLLGATFAACSVIWAIDSWSILKQSGIYFAITSVVMMPVAYLLNWMQHSVSGFLLYFGIFLALFVSIWVFQYILYKPNIKTINQNLNT